MNKYQALNFLYRSFILFCIYFFIILFIFFQYKIKSIGNSKNWPKYKCNPLVKPFAGYIRGSKDPDFNQKNHNECLANLNLNVFNQLQGPIINSYASLNNNMKNQLKSLESRKDLISSVRNSIGNFAQNIFNRFQKVEEQLRIFFIKLMSFNSLFEGLGVIFQYFFNIINNFLIWIMNLPLIISFVIIGVLLAMIPIFSIFFLFLSWMIPIVIGLAILFAGIPCCFDPETEIILEDNAIVSIDKVKIGQKILKGGKVISILKFINNQQMYQFNNVIVSGDHLVFHQSMNKWMRIKDVPEAQKITSTSKYIYCLNTEHNLIVTKNNTLFADYQEYNDPKFHLLINKLVLNNLNKTVIDEKENYYTNNNSLNNDNNITNIDNTIISQSGFGGDTLIRTRDGLIRIKDIQIGQLLDDFNIVTGTIISDIQTDDLYLYQDTILSGQNIIKNNSKWQFLRNLSNVKKINYESSLIYHLTTTKGIINVGQQQLIFRDYNETTDKKIHNYIDQLSTKIKTSKNIFFSNIKR